MGLEQIVNVNISRSAATISRAGFGVPMILGQHTRFGERIRYYTSLAGMVSDGFLTSDAEYKAAAALMAQPIKVTRFGIGRRTAPVAQVLTVDVTTVANATLYTVTINGVLCNYTSDADATATEIRDGLIAAINGSSQASKVTAALVDADSFTVTSDVLGEAFSFAVTANLTGTLTTPNNGPAEDIQAVRDEDDDWYALMLTSRTVADIRLTAAHIEGLRKLFLACNEDAAVLTGVSTDIASVLEAANYFRTAFLWSGDQENFTESRLAGARLPLDPGSETWNFAQLAGGTPDLLTAGQITNLENKKANYFQTVAGVSIVQNGQVAGGEWIDVIRGIDWLQARISERVYGVLISVPKVPYTDAGVAQIQMALEAQLTEAVRVGLLSSYTVSVPKVADVDPADRQARLLPDVTFNGTLAGAVHAVEINGTVSV